MFSVLKELKNRFDHYMQTGDNSKIPADLQRIAFQSVRFWKIFRLIVELIPMKSSRPSNMVGARSTIS
jgi:hypothetical protein